MKKYLLKDVFLVSIVCLFLMSFTMTKKQEYTIPREEQLVNDILAKTSRVVQEKYNVIPYGSGAAMPGGPIKKLILSFRTKFSYSKEQLRKLLVQSVQELINQVNENEEIQQFLAAPPFNIKNIDIDIHNSDENGREVYEPGISTVSIDGGVIFYLTVNSNNTFTYSNSFEETYEEALKAIRSSSENVK